MSSYGYQRAKDHTCCYNWALLRDGEVVGEVRMSKQEISDICDHLNLIEVEAKVTARFKEDNPVPRLPMKSDLCPRCGMPAKLHDPFVPCKPRKRQGP